MKAPSEGGFLIAKIHQLAGRVFHARLRESGININPAQGRILFVLWQKDGIPIRELAVRTQLEKSTLSSMLDRLEDTGLIRRVPSQEDRRIVLIERTEKDRRLQRMYADVSVAMNEIFYAGLTKSQISTFEKTLKRILTNLINYEDLP